MAAPYIHVIAPTHLADEIDRVARELSLNLKTTDLPADAPQQPAELRRRLQSAIDEISACPGVSQIVIACGRREQTTVGLHARHVPLALPRSHDDLGDFLASPAAATTPPPDAAPAAENLPRFTEPAADNPAALQQFLKSWQQYYQRTAFLSSESPQQQRYAQKAAELAARYGWTHQATSQCNPALRKLITALHTDHDVLWVPPHHVTQCSAAERGLTAVPVWKLDQRQDEAADQVIELGSDDDAGPRARLGLGIDAGGTYTDVVLYEFAADRVVQKAKALTTKWDYTIGIANALDQLDAAMLKQVDLVSVSTTLATNAVVEGRGQKVALLIMPPYGLFHDGDIAHRPIAVIKGQMEIDGSVRAPVDEQEIRQVARQMVQREQVGAFAVAGFASHVNPEHEAQVRRILQEETGLSVTCGHDVSEQLNYRVRAQTVALNARIIPILVSFLEEASAALAARGIQAPMMVVRSDGSLMSVQTARQRPIETILSGPAASVAGARHLAGVSSAFVVDVGGTTTDTALFVAGNVRTAQRGAKVGAWQTHVQALDLRTCGLGGDSLIAHIQGKLQIGPRRVAPIAWLGAQHQDLDACFQWIQAHLDQYAVAPELMDIYRLNQHAEIDTLAAHEQRIVEALAQRPHSAHELADSVLDNWWEGLDLERLERLHLVQRCGLTPTDLLHAGGRFERWHTAAAQRMLNLMSRALQLTPQQLTEQVHQQFVRRMAVEVLKKQLDDQVNADALEEIELSRTLIDNWLRGGPGAYHVQIRLRHPIIGIGAPVGHYLPQAAELLQTQAIVPEHADVANALGAITSSVVIHRQVEICPNVQGRYSVHGMPEAPSFGELHQARAAAMRYLQQFVTEAAIAAGTRHSRIQFIVHDKVAPLADGGQVFIAQCIQARLSGRPDLARLTS